MSKVCRYRCAVLRSPKRTNESWTHPPAIGVAENNLCEIKTCLKVLNGPRVHFFTALYWHGHRRPSKSQGSIIRGLITHRTCRIRSESTLPLSTRGSRSLLTAGMGSTRNALSVLHYWGRESTPCIKQAIYHAGGKSRISAVLLCTPLLTDGQTLHPPSPAAAVMCGGVLSVCVDGWGGGKPEGGLIG